MTKRHKVYFFTTCSDHIQRMHMGYTYDDLPGLVIHREIKSVDPHGITCYTKGWIVSHLGSGYSVGASEYWRTLAQARAYAQYLCKITSWQRPKADIRRELKPNGQHVIIAAQQHAASH